jgi:hypothetical protein
VSGETGSGEVWIRGMPPDERKWRVSVAGGQAPRWRADGKELFYLQPEGEAKSTGSMMAVQVRSGETLELATPQRLFGGLGEDMIGGSIFGGWYDVMPNGQKFLMRNMSDSSHTNIPITLIQNWTKLVRTSANRREFGLWDWRFGN